MSARTMAMASWYSPQQFETERLDLGEEPNNAKVNGKEGEKACGFKSNIFLVAMLAFTAR